FQHLCRGDDGFSHQSRTGNELLLENGNFFNRNFDTKIASGNHDAVRRSQYIIELRKRVAPFDLGDDERLPSESLRSSAQGFNIGRRFDERLAHSIDVVLQRELEARAVVIGERANAKLDPRQVQTLARTQLAPDSNLAVNVVAFDAINHDLHESIA